MFRVLDHVIRETRNALLAEPRAASDEARFDRAVLVRALNILEAQQVLLPVAHWEAASGLARQLFELLVNVEEVGRQDDPAGARFRYAKFGILQQARDRMRGVEYNRATGRPADVDFKAHLESLLSSPDFEEFKQSNGRWQDHWSGKSVRVLASESASDMRTPQYEHLFRRWSEETHGAPSTIVREMFRGHSEESWIDDVLEEDQRAVGEILTMSVVLFFDLEATLTHSPHLTWEQKLAWMNALMDETREHGWAPPLAIETPSALSDDDGP